MEVGAETALEPPQDDGKKHHKRKHHKAEPEKAQVPVDSDRKDEEEL